MLTIKTYRKDYLIPYKDDIKLYLGTWSDTFNTQYLRFYNKDTLKLVDIWDKIDNSNSILVIKNFPKTDIPTIMEVSFISNSIEYDLIELLIDISNAVGASPIKDKNNTNDYIHETLSDKSYWRDYTLNKILNQ